MIPPKTGTRCPSIPVVAVVGGSAGGKSTVAASLMRALPFSTALLSIDRYYRDLSHLPLSVRERTNFDHPDALDVDLYLRHLQALSTGESVAVPVYDFVSHARVGYESIQPNTLILTEGILLLALSEIRECLDFSIFLEVTEAERLRRKIQRDTAERGRKEAYAREQFFNTVKPIHDEWVVPSKKYADLVFDAEMPLDQLTHRIQSEIMHRFFSGENG